MNRIYTMSCCLGDTNAHILPFCFRGWAEFCNHILLNMLSLRKKKLWKENQPSSFQDLGWISNVRKEENGVHIGWLQRSSHKCFPSLSSSISKVCILIDDCLTAVWELIKLRVTRFQSNRISFAYYNWQFFVFGLVRIMWLFDILCGLKFDK